MAEWAAGCLAWCDKRPVLMLSTHCRVDEMLTVPQDLGPHHPPTTIKPRVVLDYNVHKCHVDTVDQLRQYYAMQRKSMKNWPSLAWWLIDMCIINAYTLWCRDKHVSISQLDFRRTLLQQLAETYPFPYTHQQQVIPLHSRRASGPHFPALARKTVDCMHCSTRAGKRKRTKYECDRCHAHLCVTPCFKEYHTQQHPGA